MDFDSSSRKQNKYCLREPLCQLHFKILDVHNGCGYAAKDTLWIRSTYSFSEKLKGYHVILWFIPPPPPPRRLQSSSILKLMGYKWSTCNLHQEVMSPRMFLTRGFSTKTETLLALNSCSLYKTFKHDQKSPLTPRSAGLYTLRHQSR